ncbi:hypothetical protein [Sphingobium sp. MK2]|uniref:hypothetical protein n=1 Tax=Sphingobium sp. MK2 TaxID=3116540 RepID=UPI0032E366A5
MTDHIIIPALNPPYAEEHPVLAPIIAKRAHVAANFTPEFSGQRGQDFDRGLLCAFEAVNGALQKLTMENPIKAESLADVETRVLQDWRWGNLTRLGVANHLRRGGFKQEVAIRKANTLPQAHAVTAIRITRMYESCERTTYYVDLVSSEGFTNTVAAHVTGSVYNNHVGLSVEEARDRALIDADTWADFFGVKPEPYLEEGVTYEPSMLMRRYETRRVLAARRAAEESNS